MLSSSALAGITLSGHRTYILPRMCAVFRVYSPKCLEGVFSEVRVQGLPYALIRCPLR